MNQYQTKRDVLALIKASFEDTEGFHIAVDTMDEKDLRTVFKSMTGFAATTMAMLALMTGQDPIQAINGIEEIADIMDGPR